MLAYQATRMPEEREQGHHQYADSPKSQSFNIASALLSVSRKFSGLMSLQQVGHSETPPALTCGLLSGSFKARSRGPLTAL